MKIVVIGGTGLIGRRLVRRLAQRGHEVVAASPNTGVNTLTGEGLRAALQNAHKVVDVSNAPNWEDDAVLRFFNTATGNLLAAEADAAVRHHIALSVVGTERLQASGYFRAKLRQEQLIGAATLPYTIVRATQFFEFLGRIADAATDGSVVRLPSAWMQPMSADDVAAALADYTVAPPLNRMVEIAGPDALGIDEAARRFLAAVGDPRHVIADPEAPYYGIRVASDTLLPGAGARLAPTHLNAWLAQQVHATTA